MVKENTPAGRLVLRGCLHLANARQAAPDGPVDILIDGGVIAAIGPDISPPDAVDLDARGLLAIPGLINAHLHSPAAFLKGALVDAPLEIFMLRETPPTLAGTESPRMCRARALLSAIEMLKRGITSVHDDAFFNPEPTMDAIDAIMGGYRDIGIRATVALDQPVEVVLPVAVGLGAVVVQASCQRGPEIVPIRAHVLDLGKTGIGRPLGAVHPLPQARPVRVVDDLLAEGADPLRPAISRI